MILNQFLQPSCGDDEGIDGRLNPTLERQKISVLDKDILVLYNVSGRYGNDLSLDL